MELVEDITQGGPVVFTDMCWWLNFRTICGEGVAVVLVGQNNNGRNFQDHGYLSHASLVSLYTHRGSICPCFVRAPYSLRTSRTPRSCRRPYSSSGDAGA